MKKNLIKICTIICSISILAGVLCGCGQKEVSEGDVETVRVWTGQRHMNSVVTALIDNYNETTGKELGIKIEYSDYGDTFKNTYEMAFASEKEPELYATVSMRPEIEKGWIIPIEDFEGASEYISSRREKIVDGLQRINGKVYTLPFAYTNMKFVYNKDLFKKNGIVDENGNALAPKTLEDVIKYAKIITENGKGVEYGIVLPMKDPAYFWEWEIARPFQKAVGPYYDAVNTKYDFTNYGKVFTDYLLKIKADKSYLPGAEGIDNDIARAQFSEGAVGMKPAVSWDVAVFNEQFPAKCDWGITDVLIFENGEEYKENVLVSNSPVVISRAAKKLKDPNKAFEVFKWFNSDEFKTAMYENALYIISDDTIAQNAQKAPELKGWKEFSSFTTDDMYFVRCPAVDIQTTETYINVFEKIWLGEISDIDGALKELTEVYNKGLGKNIENGKVKIEEYTNKDIVAKIK